MSDPEIERIMLKKMKELREKMLNPVIELDSKGFYKALNADKPLLIDFWASWCSPCRFMHPIFEKVAKIYSNKVIFARINVDEEQEIAARYKVQAIPTFMLFINGKSIDRLVGVVDENTLTRFIKRYIE